MTTQTIWSIFMRNRVLHTCRVCGYYDKELLPWGEDGETPTFEICPCCNVEFGYEDVQLSSIKSYREKWMNSDKFNSDEKYFKLLANIATQFFL